MGVASSAPGPFRRFRNSIPSSASAHVVSTEEDDGQSFESDITAPMDGDAGLDIDAISANDPVVAKAYNSSAKCQCPLPKGGYMTMSFRTLVLLLLARCVAAQNMG
jgi:hypothetical protein